MTEKTESKRVGDVLMEEFGVFGYCRRAKIAKSGAVLNIGSVVELDAFTAEVHTVGTFTGTGSSGTYTISFWDEIAQEMRTTADIADAANTATINAALDAAASVVGAVVSSGTIESTSWVITYSGTQYQGINVPLTTVDVSSWTGVSVCTFVQTTPGSDTAGDAILITEPANVWGMCLENLGTLSADTKALFLVRGPAVVNSAQLGINSLVLGEIEAALLRLGIVARSEPATSEFQTT